MLAAAGCVSRGPVLPEALTGADTDRRVELSGTPFFPQTRYYCGPAALATVLTHAGADADPQRLASQVYLPDKQGSLQIELVAASRRHQRLAYRIDPELGDLLAELRAGRPVLVFQNLGIKLIPVWHYAVMVGYDPVEDTVVLRSGEERRRVTAAADFLETWERADRWGIVVLRPGEMPVDPDVGRYLSAVAAMEPLAAPESVLSWLTAARERWPGNALVQLALGNAYYAHGRAAPAETAYRRAVSRNPALLPARNNLAHLLSERGCASAALAQINQALTVDDSRAALTDTLKQTRSEIEQRAAANGEAGGGSCP